MPTVLRSGPYRFFFYSADRDEPPHVHGEREDSAAKFWLSPVRLSSSSHWRLIGAGSGIHWPDLDEDISLRSLLAGRRSGESQESLQRWLAAREAPRADR
ncbi:MAG: DUF4160 domain-containing protein [Acidobacteriia bacterium]|nr:DUF4160 domain-containing protein [Terriglobia bacterium]